MSAVKLLADKKLALLILGIFLMVGFDVGINTHIVSYMKGRFRATYLRYDGMYQKKIFIRFHPE